MIKFHLYKRKKPETAVTPKEAGAVSVTIVTP